MLELVHDDVVEWFLIRLDVKDLFRCKSVCKLWYSLITSPGFINLHMNRGYNNDRFNNRCHRRILTMTIYDFFCLSCHGGNHNHTHVVGSSNGLVCISFSDSGYLVSNPLTREVRRLKRLPSIREPACWGFGYDSSSDDYKVVVGVWNVKNVTCALRVLSLKSNVWRVVAKVKCRKFILSVVGVLCNGALYWIINDQNNKNLIMSFDLSKEEFKEVLQPEDARFECTSSSGLRIIKERLCIFERSGNPDPPARVWLMKSDSVKQSWELLPYDHEIEYGILHFLKIPENESFFHDDASWLSDISERQASPLTYVDAPLYVQSLVSPHVNGKPMHASYNKVRFNLPFNFLSFIPKLNKRLALMLLKK